MPRKTRTTAMRKRDDYLRRCAEEDLQDLTGELREERGRRQWEDVVDAKERDGSEDQ